MSKVLPFNLSFYALAQDVARAGCVGETPAILGDDGPVELRVLSDVAHALFRSGVSQGYMSRRKPPAKSPTYLLCALRQDSVSRTC
jgi:hypothetical protein